MKVQIYENNRFDRPTRRFNTFLPRRSSFNSLITTAATRHTAVAAFEHSHASTQNILKIRWAFSGKRKPEKLLQDLTWFVDRFHALIPMNPISGALRTYRRLRGWYH